MKIGIMSDLHLGHRQYGSIDREKDFYKQFHKCVEEINKHDCDMTIIAGDIFDTANPSPEAIHEYESGLKDLKSDIIIVIQGNHTMLLRDGHYSIDKFFNDSHNIEGYKLLDDESWSLDSYIFQSNYEAEYRYYKDKKKLEIDGITYRGNSQLNEFINVSKLLSSQLAVDGACRILVVHQAFKEFCGFSGEELSIYDIDFDKYDLVICGHIHSPLVANLSDKTIFLQPGSIERLNTTEARDEIENGKGIYVFDVNENDLSYYPVKCDRKFIMGNLDIHTKEDMKNHVDEIIDMSYNLDVQPIICYEYFDYVGDIGFIREEILRLNKNANILINNSNVHDKTEKDISVDIKENEIPSVVDAILNSDSGLSDEEKLFAIDIYNAFAQSEDVSALLSDYQKKHFNHEYKEEKE